MPTKFEGLAADDRHEDAALKEIAGRLKKLSYRDMTRLAGLVITALNRVAGPPDDQILTYGLLAAADDIDGTQKL